MDKPWPRGKLDLHVAQQLRGSIKTILEWDIGDDNLLVPVLKENGENDIWQTIQEAIEDAGWHMVKKNPVIEESIRILRDRAKEHI